MRWLPYALIYSRIFLGLIIILIAFKQVNHHATWIVGIMIFALLTDVFDGIIARKIGLNAEKIRTHDSNVDVIFWILTLFSIFYLNATFLMENIVLISIVVGLELCTYIVGFFKFKRTVATHSLMAKAWTISLLIFLIDLTLTSSANISFWICIILGIISRLEIISIILVLKKWTTDVPSLRAASRINKGLVVKKSKLFNS